MAFDMNSYPELHPAASLSLGGIDFGRARLWHTVKDLTPEQLSVRPHAFPNDIATLILHIGASEVGMAHLIMGKQVPADLVQMFLIDKRTQLLPRPEGETVESLQEKLAKSLELVREAYAGVTDADFAREVPFGQTTATVRSMITLMPMHQLLHLGHIQSLLKHLD